MTAPRAVRLAELIDAFDIFFLDQFGTLHDGHQPYDGAVAALRHIRAGSKRIVLLSNSGKRASANAARLQALGIPPDCYDRLITSGEVAWQMLSAGRLDLPQGRGGPLRCLLLERNGDGSSIEGLGFEAVDGGADADLVMIAGSEGDRLSLADYRQRLAPAADRKAPALCTNPDTVMLTASGPAFGSGRIAEMYAELGGAVTWIGKPYPDIYSAALEAIGATPADRILCIGDSVEHDIAGARAAGLASALVVGTGILAGLSPAEREAAYARHQATPDFLLPSFSLG